MQKKRPKHLDIGQIRLPVPGIVSILHRISGVALFFSLPLFIYLLSGSLSSEADFDTYRAVVSHPLMKLVLIGLLWAFLHHLCAGIRFLLLDLHVGVDKESSVKSARMVLIVSSTDAITLKVDPSVVLATRQHVTETVARAVSDHIAQPDPHPHT